MEGDVGSLVLASSHNRAPRCSSSPLPAHTSPEPFSSPATTQGFNAQLFVFFPPCAAQRLGHSQRTHAKERRCHRPAIIIVVDNGQLHRSVDNAAARAIRRRCPPPRPGNPPPLPPLSAEASAHIPPILIARCGRRAGTSARPAAISLFDAWLTQAFPLPRRYIYRISFALQPQESFLPPRRDVSSHAHARASTTNGGLEKNPTAVATGKLLLTPSKQGPSACNQHQRSHRISSHIGIRPSTRRV